MSMAEKLVAAVPSDRTLLIVEDDKSFLQRLARAMENRGFTVMTAESVAEGLMQLETASPAFAVVDMRLGDGNGLEVISALKRRGPARDRRQRRCAARQSDVGRSGALGAHPAHL